MIAVLAAALLAGHATPPKSASTMPACQQNELRPAGGTPRAGPHRLDQELPARHLYAVLHTEDGCTKPVFVNDRVIGGTPRR